mmetsp:Transcript_13189/g.20052  ORF Transcript_13189/g.20052 Transcript_13189/m.20052 type:complete len:452 (+) Transcript_13189:983-2338(+)
MNILFIHIVLLCFFVPRCRASDQIDNSYGVDVSFPIFSPNVSPGSSLHGRQEFYNEFMRGCRDYEGKRGSACDQVEKDRIEMSRRQPRSMVNYTDTGFRKIRAPQELMDLLLPFWEEHKDEMKKENWFVGNTYVNHWKSPSYMVNVENAALRGGGGNLKQKIWDAAKSSIQEWTGQELTPCSMYGIRAYTSGAVLAPHVDRLPLVSSAIVNVAQDVDEPWPLEVYGRDNKAHNVTMEPGDMVLYESHSLIHGRPFELKGRYYANIFIHFEPTGHSLKHYPGHKFDYNVDALEREAKEKGHGGHENKEKGLPSYILDGSPEESNWRKRSPATYQNIRGRGGTKAPPVPAKKVAHAAAQEGNVAALKKLAVESKELIHKADENGWHPIHEGARAGHEEVVKLLVEHGADYNIRTNQGKGGTPLWLAVNSHGEDHLVAKFLQSLGAMKVGPDEL